MLIKSSHGLDFVSYDQGSEMIFLQHYHLFYLETKELSVLLCACKIFSLMSFLHCRFMFGPTRENGLTVGKSRQCKKVDNCLFIHSIGLGLLFMNFLDLIWKWFIWHAHWLDVQLVNYIYIYIYLFIWKCETYFRVWSRTPFDSGTNFTLNSSPRTFHF